MSWKPEIEELERRLALARQMGGAEGIARQHERGKLTVRERIEALADPGPSALRRRPARTSLTRARPALCCASSCAMPSRS
jgi:acetyl-CoA carboxylase carboxyltransferase component